jgi:hypothetical protein
MLPPSLLWCLVPSFSRRWTRCCPTCRADRMCSDQIHSIDLAGPHGRARWRFGSDRRPGQALAGLVAADKFGLVPKENAFG